MLRTLSHYMAGPSATLQQQLAACSHVLGSVSSFNPSEFTLWQNKRWATKKQGGSTKNKPDSNPKHLGTKMTHGQLAFPGQIIVRQRGSKFVPGVNVGQGVDFTLFAKSVGYVTFRRKLLTRPNRPSKHMRIIDVLPLNGEYGPEYKEKVQLMVQERAKIRQRVLGLKARYS